MEIKRPRPLKHRLAELDRIDFRKATWTFEWMCEWIAYWLSKWALLEVLEYLGKLGILVAAIAYIYPGCEERRQTAEDAKKTKHYVAWQTLNSAVGKPGNAGRVDALKDLAQDGVSLDEVSLVGGARLEGPLELTNAQMADADFSDANIDNVNFSGASMALARFDNAFFRNCDFRGCSFFKASFSNASFEYCNFDTATNATKKETDFLAAKFHSDGSTPNFTMCSFVGATFAYAKLGNATFKWCNFAKANFSETRADEAGGFDQCNFFKSTNASIELLRGVSRADEFIDTDVRSYDDWISWANKNESTVEDTERYRTNSSERFMWGSNQWTALKKDGQWREWLWLTNK